jgi:hypothetical protein
MRVLGVSGHQILPEIVRAYAEPMIIALLVCQPKPVIGLSSLAEGADQLFAEAVLRSGGTLHVVVPAHGYEDTFRGTARQTYHRLLAVADIVTTLEYDKPCEQAYDAAARFIAEHCDLLIAVWDGQPARGLGGTADAVAHARRLGREVVIVWPKGVARP